MVIINAFHTIPLIFFLSFFPPELSKSFMLCLLLNFTNVWSTSFAWAKTSFVQVCFNQLSRGSTSLIFIHFASLSQYFNFWYFGIFEKPNIFRNFLPRAEMSKNLSLVTYHTKKRSSNTTPLICVIAIFFAC